MVTRRQIADLGNVRSRTIRRLIEFLRQQRDGYEHFQRMGLVRRPPRDEWQRAEANSLLGCLRPWSAKQVRTHFDKLRRAGMITAKREYPSGPWQYELPEELESRTSVFRRLPEPAELISRSSGR